MARPMDPSERPFLEVESSLSGQRWVERASRIQLGWAQAMAEDHDIDRLIARILAGREVEPDQARQFLNPTLRELLPNPSTLTQMDEAAQRLAAAVQRRERVAVFGDYDVDGATSSALMHKFLSHCGVASEIYIPDRIFEGYGPNIPAIEQLAEAGAQLLVTVDCGSTSHESIARANGLGMEVVVLDHHQVSSELPDALAVVNPNRDDDMSGQGHVCAAGVVFLALVATARELRNANWFSDKVPAPNLMEWLDLVALGTVCDVVPLKGINRAFVLRGLEVMRQQKNVGLVALARAARQDGPAAAWHLGFLLGPRINAGGRIGDAGLGARLLTCNDPSEAEEIANRLDGLNSERQAMENEMLKQAIDEAEAEIGLGEGPAVLVTESETWHAGVVGLLASRLKDRFRRPAFAISFDGRGIGSGSGRSIPGVDLGAAVRQAVEMGRLEKGGGHVMAAGITIKREQLGAFRTFLEERFTEQVTELSQNRQLKIDAALSARGATQEFFDRLEQAGPYGAGHSQPVFAFPGHTISHASVVGANHVRFSLRSPDGAPIDGIGFRIADEPLGKALLSNIGSVMHVAGMLSADFYRGRRRIQLRLLDAAEIPDKNSP
ncbi:MAG: single-stranded-DNA-specific exonuclease RecJ [Rhizobiaceae bacterium]|nr:single-stranded-DNA-specific exonuclease RecJ [Rhizobiaceae bacterium]